MTIRLLLLAGSIAAAASGQTATLSGPTCGLIFDSFTHSLRPCLGVAGSASVGRAIRENVRFAVVAPSGASAIVVADESSLEIVTVAKATVDLGTAADLSMAAWAADSSSISWNVTGTRTIQSMRMSDPGRIQSQELPQGSLTALAVSANGVPLVATADESGTALSLLGTEGPRLLSLCSPLLGFGLTRDSAYLLSADGTEIAEVAGIDGAAAVVPFARIPADRNPVAMVVDETRRRLYLAVTVSPERSSQRARRVQPAQARLLVYDLETRAQIEETALDLTPEFFRTMRSGLFLTNQRTSDSDSFFVLDFQSEGRVFFIPSQN